MATTYYYSVGGEIFGESTGGVMTTYMSDALGSTIGTIKAGAVVNQYTYKPYGGLLSKTGTGADPRYMWNARSQYRTTGRNHAEEYAKRRHFSSAMAQWTSSDITWPRRWAYGYVNERPVTVKDPAGLSGDPGSGGNWMGGYLNGLPTVPDAWWPSGPSFPSGSFPLAWSLFVTEVYPPAWVSGGGACGGQATGVPGSGWAPIGGPRPADPHGYNPTYALGADPGKCAAALLQLLACLAGAAVDVGIDVLLGPIPWRPPNLSPEPPPPIWSPPVGGVPTSGKYGKYGRAINQGFGTGGEIGYGIGKATECWIQYNDACNGAGTEPWQACPQASKTVEECNQCCANYGATGQISNQLQMLKCQSDCDSMHPMDFR